MAGIATGKVYSLTRLVPLVCRKTHEKMGDYTPVPKDIFSRGSTRRYNPHFIAADVRPEKIAETESLQQYACRHLGERLPEMAREGRLENCQAIHRTLADAGLWMRVQHGHRLSVTVMIITRLPFVLTAYGRC